MKLKTLLSLSIIALSSFSSAEAQDKLYKRNGDKEEVKIKEIGTQTITYKKWSNPDGPDYVISKSDVSRVKFENGDEEEFARNSPHRPGMRKERGERGPRMSHERDTRYGKNILAFSPIHMTNTSVTGFGLSYERVLDRNYHFSFNLPVAYAFRNESRYDGYTSNANASVFWLYPGLKFYPSGSDHIVTYAVGPTFAFGMGQEPRYSSVYQNGVYTNKYEDQDIFVVGLQATNYLNIQASPRIYIGLQLGFGIRYYTNAKEDHANNYFYYDSKYYSKNTTIPISDFSFRVGYRF